LRANDYWSYAILNVEQSSHHGLLIAQWRHETAMTEYAQFISESTNSNWGGNNQIDRWMFVVETYKEEELSPNKRAIPKRSTSSQSSLIKTLSSSI